MQSQRNAPARTSTQRAEQVSIQEIGHDEDERDPWGSASHRVAGRHGEMGERRHETRQQDGRHQAGRKRRERHDEPIVEHPDSDEEGEDDAGHGDAMEEQEAVRGSQQTGVVGRWYLHGGKKVVLHGLHRTAWAHHCLCDQR